MIIDTAVDSVLTQAKTTQNSVNSIPTIYLGTGGYSDTDLLGTLYPTGTKKTDFLREYAKQYGAVEINSTFYAPIGQRPLQVWSIKLMYKLTVN